MDPSRIEFVAEESIVTIVSRFKNPSIEIFGKVIGPFIPNTPINVSLWLALNLRSQQKCRIIPPDWCNVEILTQYKEAEEHSQVCLQPPHPHYVEIVTLLHESAPEDVANIDSIRTLIKDLWDIRVGKLIASANNFTVSDASTAKVSNFTSLELSSIRDLFTSNIDQITRLRSLEDQRSRLNQSTMLSRSYLSSN